MYAYLHQHYVPQVSEPLTIDSRQVSFLIDPIQEHVEFQSNAVGDEWLLTFFKHSDFPQSISVKFSRIPECTHKCLARAAWFDNRNDSRLNASYRKAASAFARNADSLDVSVATSLSENRSLLTDRSTCLYFSFDQVQFQRIVICLALAVAYTEVVRSALQAMTAYIKNQEGDKILALYGSMLKFNAADYFALPVRIERHELMAAWDQIYEHFRLKALNEELTDQLSRVASLLRSDAEQAQRANEARQQARAQRRDWALTVAGLVIAGVSLLQLVQLTPQHFKEARANWLGAGVSAVAQKGAMR